MKLSIIATLLVAACVTVYAQVLPRMTTAEPGSGKAGDEIAVAGENLAKDQVAKVYLTDGSNDVEVSISEQTASSIKFKVPAKAKGRLALMILTTGKDSKLIEQPVKVTIE
jgi:hypothetical protein